MAAVVKKVDYYYTLAPNKAGVGARVFNALKDEGVNLVAFICFPVSEQQSQLDFVPSNHQVFLDAAKKAGLKLVGPKTAFLIQGEDRVGAVTDVLDRLEKAHINITAFHAIAAGAGRFGAIFWVKPRNVNRAAQAVDIS